MRKDNENSYQIENLPEIQKYLENDIITNLKDKILKLESDKKDQ